MPKHPSREITNADGIAPVPVVPSARISNLDALRGFAVLGILLMNGVSFGLLTAAYFNLSADGSASVIDRVIGVAGEIFIDHKMMGHFSVLFGAVLVSGTAPEIRSSTVDPFVWTPSGTRRISQYVTPSRIPSFARVHGTAKRTATAKAGTRARTQRATVTGTR